MIIFTSICANYTHKARLLAESVKKNIPDAKFIVCLTERYVPENVKNDLFDEIYLAKDVWKSNFDHFIFKHAIVEASTAVKGRFLQYLLETYEQEDKFIYLDPDCYVYDDFVELRVLLDKTPIVVCPHLLQPGNIEMELSATSHGVYNLGFLAVRRSEEGIKFVDWWAQRLGLYCYDDIPRGIFTDQKWVDLAPCFFDVEIFKHKGYDFSIWSLLDCGMSEVNDKYYIQGSPLRFIHFSGQGAMTEKCMKQWLPEGPHPFKKLYKEYSKLHDMSDSDNVSKTSWTYSTYSSGEQISDAIRVAYRDNISWLQIENPFSLSDQLIGDKLGISDVSVVTQKVDASVTSGEMKILDQFYRLWSKGKDIVFYGAGKHGKVFYEFCQKRSLPVAAFMISDKIEREEYCGIPVVSVCENEINRKHTQIIITMSYSQHEMVRQTLIDNGFENIFILTNKKEYEILYDFMKNANSN